MNAVADAALLLLAVLWTGAVLRRLPRDVRELGESSESAARAAIVIVWILTAPVALWLVRQLLAVGRGLSASLH